MSARSCLGWPAGVVVGVLALTLTAPTAVAQTAVGAAPAPAPAAAPATPAADPIGHGRRVYTSLCARCHGLNLASNGLGADLRQFPADGQERFRTSVNQGLRAMPAWGTILKPGDLEALWAYIGSVNGWPAVPPS